MATEAQKIQFRRVPCGSDGKESSCKARALGGRGKADPFAPPGSGDTRVGGWGAAIRPD